MILKKVTISGYRSVTGTTTLHLDPAVTVILGANDHGKTNILRAIEHLNPEHEIDRDTDLSWDRDDVGESPQIEFLFTLSEDDRAEIREAIDRRDIARIAAANATTDAEDDASGDEDDETDEDDEEEDEDEDEDGEAAGEHPSEKPLAQPVAEVSDAPARKAPTVPRAILAARKGVASAVMYYDATTGMALDDDIYDYFTPRVELIEPTSRVSDSVTAAEIVAPENGFMRGIFRYAGLDPDASEELFVQSQRTQRKLEDASVVLNDTIKRSWSQGKDLAFLLRHNSAKKSIELHIKDPAVANRYVSASQRSAGFTQFFTIKTILYARQQEHPARSYIWLFDEPGIFLHPAGQQDLLQVIESLGRANQVVYVTHSLFMINKSRPARHRLVVKGTGGTAIEGKPFVGRWARALTALGMSLSGTILFANHVLLVEGDSDPIYLNAIMQKLIEDGRLDADLNAFSAISTGQSKDADALIRILLETQPAPAVAVLVDGDEGGRKRLERLRPVLSARSVPSKALADGMTIEDYLPNLNELFVQAVAIYCAKLLTDTQAKAVSVGDILPSLQVSFAEFVAAGSAKGAAAWLRDDAAKLIGLTISPSKVGVAREYAILLQELPLPDFRSGSRASHLVKWIIETLGISPLGIDEPAILQSAEE